MKKFIVIGLGNLGYSTAKTLMDNNCEVLGIDTNRTIVQEAKDEITHAVVGDATNKSVLESLSLKNFDGAVVSIGQEMASSILITLYLKEIGIKKILVRAISADHEKILKMLDISDIIFPEKEIAERVGMTLAMKNVFDYLPLTDEYAITDVTPPQSFIGKSLKELNIGAQFSCQVIGIKILNGKIKASQRTKDNISKTIMAPKASQLIYENSILLVLGRQGDIQKLQNTK